MLCGNALRFVYNVIEPSPFDFEHALSLFRDSFFTPEYTRTFVTEFDTLSLRSVMLKNPGLRP